MDVRQSPSTNGSGLTERADRNGRLRIALDLLPEIVGWLLLMHQREMDVVQAALDRDPERKLPYTNGVCAAGGPRCDMLAQLIDRAADAFPQKEYGEALVRVGMMISARTVAGEPMTKIGRLFAKEGVASDGPRKG